jgi:PhnB protein
MEFMIQLYVKNATEAIEIYSKAFDGTVGNIDYTPDKKVLHSEMLAHGQKIAIADSHESAVTGNVYQIDVRMKTEDAVKKAYELLMDGSLTNVPLGPVFWSPCMVDFTDRFGVRWCLFAE